MFESRTKPIIYPDLYYLFYLVELAGKRSNQCARHSLWEVSVSSHLSNKRHLTECQNWIFILNKHPLISKKKNKKKTKKTDDDLLGFSLGEIGLIIYYAMLQRHENTIRVQLKARFVRSSDTKIIFNRGHETWLQNNIRNNIRNIRI